ncbi:SWIM zinc finger family protein [Shewanella surugensis]|uniref:SWIM zinc finger family protein n=1 Tax=Shewanella surugensis TaxID=212020 RepID=A0ABT0L6S6_9GAMM|nr:SWIM zinc finger family protein [Shewanella surugensis]MCL1123389.1 SWIM zinc finger family protein [Shewanella surugensis]
MFNLKAIKDSVSSKSYDLGYGLYASNSVSKLMIVDNQVTASVAGQHLYKVTLDSFEGETQASCTCPAAEYQDVCKHAVAVGLQVEHLSTAELAELGAERAEQDDERAQLMAWFAAKPATELADIIMDLLEGSEHEYQKWSLLMSCERMASDTQTVDTSMLSQQIMLALPKEQVWDWNETSGYFDAADALFEVIFPAIATLTIEQQWALNLQALIRLNEVLEDIDDSGGFRFTIEGQLNENLSQLFNQLSWSDEEKAQWLFEHFKTYQYDVFPSVPDDFNITDTVNTAFLSLCQTGVDNLLKAGVDFDDWKQKSVFDRLISALVEAAQAQGDWPKQLRLLIMKADSSADYLRISEDCLARGDELDAEHYLKLAYQCVSRPYDERDCKKWEIKVRLALGECKPAWTLAWQLFMDNPSVNGFKQLQALELQTGVMEPDLLHKVEQALIEASQQTQPGFHRFGADMCEVMRFYLDQCTGSQSSEAQQMLEKARAWAASHSVAPDQWVKLADVIMTEHPQEAMALYYKSLSAIIAQTHNDAYREATDLLLKIEKQLKATNGNCTQLYDMIGDIIKHFKQKRNMMKLLRQHFPQCF